MILYPVTNVFYPSGDICRSGYKIITAADVLHILFCFCSMLYCITFFYTSAMYNLDFYSFGMKLSNM